MSKILYVEDEAFLAKIVKESMERSGHEVCHVSDGARAKDAFLSFVPDICVLDIMLPNLNGYEIATQIKEVDTAVPIIFLTAKSQTEDLVKGFQSGGRDYVRKPFSMEELLVRIDSLLQVSIKQPKDLSQSVEYIFGDFTFYTIKQQLAHKTEVKILSHKESMILEMLCQHINGSIDRKAILLKIWGDDSYFNSRNLDVYIRKIRKYLAPDPGVRIVTLKGIGYSFIVEG